MRQINHVLRLAAPSAVPRHCRSTAWWLPRHRSYRANMHGAAT